MTKHDVIERLLKLDELTVLELLDISTEDIIDAFLDKIDERSEFLHKSLEE